ncbi:MAG: DoxX family membrane protein [Phycisphaerales bacterium JB041]
MRKRDSAGLAIAPLFLRLVLALVFIWAGLGKFVHSFPVQGEDAAVLANYGVIPNPHAPSRAAPPIDSDDAADPIAPEEGDTDGGGAIDSGEGPQARNGPAGPGSARLVSFQGAEPARVLATGADFPEAVEVRGYAGLVLALHRAINPGLNPDDSTPLMRLWPDFDPGTEYDPWPRHAALAAALTELIGGILILVGLLTRFSAFAISNVMLVAMWLTGFGPAIQSGSTRLGFLPDYPWFGSDQWTLLLFQFSLCGAALALVFAGPGTLSLDRLLLGGSRKAPPPPPPKPQGKK